MENIHPLGINKITVMQTQFNQHTDYVVPIDEADSVYEMYADYFTSPVTPEEKENVEDINISDYSLIKSIGHPPKLYLGGNYKTFTITFYDKDGCPNNETHPMTKCNWQVLLNGIDILHDKNLINFIAPNAENFYQIKIRFYGNNNRPVPITENHIDYNTYKNSILVVQATDDNGKCLSSVEVHLSR